MDVRPGCELDVISDLPVVYNLVDFGEIPNHAVRSLDVTAVEKNMVCQLAAGNRPGHTCASTGEGHTAGRDSDTTLTRKRPSTLLFDHLDPI